jgi:lanosterol synthase
VAVISVTAARDRAIAHLLSRQSARGDWEGEVVWCPLITAQYVIVQRVTGRAIGERVRAGLVRHFEVTARSDGGWGLHPESGSYVFVTGLAYVALRLLGVDADAPLTRNARRWLHAQPGGMVAIPSWGKFWLALLDLFDWAGVNPCPPELWLLPRAVPFHPARYYCHTRHIYLAMAYLYGRRFRADLGALRDALRKELYAAPYESIDFAAHRHDVAVSDLYVRPGAGLRRLYDGLTVWERTRSTRLRRRALDRCFERILYEQRTTCYGALSPVNGLLNCLAIFDRDPRHPELPPSLDGLEQWRWEDEAEGVRYAGARSNAWDTAFALQALHEPRKPDASMEDASRRACAFLRDTQMTSEIPGGSEQDRDPAVGGWCFSDGRHRWPVSDCTAEALSSILRAQQTASLAERLSQTRIREAVAFILARQNHDGSFGSYERRRAAGWVETLNPSEMFGACMTERSYVECTASAVGAFAHVRESDSGLPRGTLDRAIERGVKFLRAAQRPDGSVPGFWGINFTYGIFHFVRGLRATGVTPDDPALVRAAAWLTGAQKSDGGWGEHHSSCLTGRYVAHPSSQAVMTSWALLALMEIVGASAAPVERGIAWLIARQGADGSWPPEAVNGVFFGSAMLDYRLYRAYFPTWALARYVAAREMAAQ